MPQLGRVTSRVQLSKTTHFQTLNWKEGQTPPSSSKDAVKYIFSLREDPKMAILSWNGHCTQSCALLYYIVSSPSPHFNRRLNGRCWVHLYHSVVECITVWSLANSMPNSNNVSRKKFCPGSQMSLRSGILIPYIFKLRTCHIWDISKILDVTESPPIRNKLRLD